MFDDPTRFIESIDPSYGRAHCAILDMRMQGLRGLDMQRALIERGVPIPVIFLSGESEMTEVISALKNGAADFLLKPVDTDELLNAITHAHAHAVDNAAASLSLTLEKKPWNMPRLHHNHGQHHATGMYLT